MASLIWAVVAVDPRSSMYDCFAVKILYFSCKTIPSHGMVEVTYVTGRYFSKFLLIQLLILVTVVSYSSGFVTFFISGAVYSSRCFSNRSRLNFE